METLDDEHFDQIIAKIESKLTSLEQKRDEIAHKIRLQRAQIDELSNTIDKLRKLEERLSQTPRPDAAQ